MRNLRREQNRLAEQVFAACSEDELNYEPWTSDDEDSVEIGSTREFDIDIEILFHMNHCSVADQRAAADRRRGDGRQGRAGVAAAR